MAAKFFTGLPLDGPDPECVQGYGAAALASVGPGQAPKSSEDHSHRTSPRSTAVPVTIGRRPPQLSPGGRPARIPPAKGCDENPLAGFTVG